MTAPYQPAPYRARADDDFALALGYFVLVWADAEMELYKVLVRYAGVDDAVARALLSGTRASGMIDFMNTIMHNTKIDAGRSADLTYVLEQMGHINGMRDKLTHYLSGNSAWVADEPTSRVLTNSGRVSRPGKQFAYLVDARDISAMTLDLIKIINHLCQHWLPERLGRPFSVWRDHDSGGRPKPWRYKPPQPISAPGKKPSTPQKRGDLRKPSKRKS